jgi:hypothetical protein
MKSTRSAVRSIFGIRSMSMTALALLMLHGSAAGQPQRERPAKPEQKQKASPRGAAPATAAPKTGVVEFGDTPIQLDSLGLWTPVPVGATVTKESFGTRSEVRVVGPGGRWIIDIKGTRADPPELTPVKAAETMRDVSLVASGRVFERDPKSKVIGVQGRIIEDVREISVENLPTGARYYIEANDAPDTPPILQGFTIFRVTAENFVTFELRTNAQDFPQARLAYESMIAASRFTDPVDLAADRKAAIEAGLAVLAKVDETMMRQIIEERPERWLRLYVPAPGGAGVDETEVGYQRVRMNIGARGELDPSKTKAQWREEDRDEGYIIRLDGRALDGDNMVDWNSVMFLSLDRQREAWTTRNAMRAVAGRNDRKAVPQTSEIGARDGRSLLVRVQMPNGSRDDIRPLFPQDFESSGYLSRVESFLLPQLLIKGGVAADFGFYTYQPEERAVKLRRDSLRQPSDQPGLWELTTRLTEDREPQNSTFNDKANMLQTIIPQADRKIVWEPIEFEALVRLWRDKGLPLE